MSAYRKRIAIVGAIAVGVVGIAGTALGAGAGSSPSFLNDFARRLGVSPAKVRTAYQGAMADRLDQLVKDGKLTKAQAERIKQHLKDNDGPGFGMGGPGFDGRGFGGPRHHMFSGPGGHPHGGPMIWLHTAAGYLGITDQQLLKELRSGKTPAAIAKAHGKTVAGLEQELLQAAKKPLTAAVKSGRITKTQAAKIEKFLSQRIDQMITHGFEFHHSWGGPPMGNGGGKSQGGTQPSAQPTVASAV